LIVTAELAVAALTISIPLICESPAAVRSAEVAVITMVSVPVPPPPVTISAPTKPWMVSLPEPPVIVSALALPVILNPSS
jgi:hypothetical protein